MQNTLQNVRFSLRMLRKNFGLSLAIVATLALGIGATTAIYTVVYATLLAPLPFPHPEQLVMWCGRKFRAIATESLPGTRSSIGQRNSRSLLTPLRFTGGNFNLGAMTIVPEQVNGAAWLRPVSSRLMGIPFQLGRDFLPEEGTPGKERVVILTHKLWAKLGANAGIVGQPLRMNGSSYGCGSSPAGRRCRPL